MGSGTAAAQAQAQAHAQARAQAKNGGILSDVVKHCGVFWNLLDYVGISPNIVD